MPPSSQPGASTCISRIRSMRHTFLTRPSKQQPSTSIYILTQCPTAAYIPGISRIFLWQAAISTPRGVYQKHLPELKALMKEGVGKKEGIPDNQKFNEQKLLKEPRIFIIEKNKK